MQQKLKLVFSYLLASPKLYVLLLLLNLLDFSGYNFGLFLGNVIFALIFTIAFTLLTNRVAFSTLLTLLLAMLIDHMTSLKAQFLTTILTYADINFLFHIKELAAEDLVSSYMQVGALIYIVLGLLLLGFVFTKSLQILEMKNHRNSFLLKRLFMILGSVAILKSVFFTVTHVESVKNLIKNAQKTHIDYCMAVNPRQNLDRALCYTMGPFLDIAVGVSEPSLSAKQVSESSDIIKKEIVKSGEEAVVNPQIIGTDLPNIVLVLNESTFDPSFLDYPFAQNLQYDFFKDQSYMKAKGFLKIHTFGGASSLTEYPSLTGVVHSMFEGPNYFPFINMAIITESSLFRELKKHGYYTIVIYPTKKDFINAESAMYALGADRVIDIFDYNFQKKDWRDIPEKFLGEIVDEELKKAPENRPVFIYLATMRNHGPHNKDVLEDNIGCAGHMSEDACKRLNDYMVRLGLTDKEWMEYMNRILSGNNKTMFIQYGDHLPNLEGEMANIKFKYPDINDSDIYRTFYNIRANFEIGDYSYDVMDISYMPSLILDIIDKNESAYFNASSLMRKKCSGKFLDCKENDVLLESYKAFMTEQLQIE